jgi:hypothetical protein
MDVARLVLKALEDLSQYKQDFEDAERRVGVCQEHIGRLAQRVNESEEKPASPEMCLDASEPPMDGPEHFEVYMPPDELALRDAVPTKAENLISKWCR